MKNSDTLKVNRYHSPAAGDDPSHTIGDPAPASLDRRPRGYAVGHAVGDPPPAPLDGRPRGFAVGRAVGDPAPATLNRRPCGFAVGHAVGDPPPASLDGRARGFTVGRAVGARSTTPTEPRRPGRVPGDRASTRTRDSQAAPSKRAA
jgi:hypothetical protein